MTLLVPIPDLSEHDVLRLHAVLCNMRHWIRHSPHTREEYDASIKAQADFDAMCHYLHKLTKGEA